MLYFFFQLFAVFFLRKKSSYQRKNNNSVRQSMQSYIPADSDNEHRFEYSNLLRIWPRNISRAPIYLQIFKIKIYYHGSIPFFSCLCILRKEAFEKKKKIPGCPQDAPVRFSRFPLRDENRVR